MLTNRSNGRRILDQWAQETGYSSFETYLASGGNIIDARRDIEHRIGRMGAALDALRQYLGDPAPKPASAVDAAAAYAVDQKNWPEVLAQIEAEEGDPVDPANAHVQGADHV